MQLDPDSFDPKNLTLSCMHLSGRHTGAALAKKMAEVYSTYGFDNSRLLAGISDNGPNIVKAFKDYAISDTDSPLLSKNFKF